MTGLDWIGISHKVVEAHDVDGLAVIPIGIKPPTEDLHLVNLTPHPLVVRGRTLRPKQDVRRWLWENKAHPALRRAVRIGFVVWTFYDEDIDTTFLGLGQLMGRERAIRFHVRNTATYRIVPVEQVVGTQVA